MNQCWYHMAMEDRCENIARWKTPPDLIDGPAQSFALAVRWCDAHRQENDVPLIDEERLTTTTGRQENDMDENQKPESDAPKSNLGTIEQAGPHSRSKTFDECTPFEQIQRLRQEILNLQHQLTYVAQSARHADRIASRHQHSAQTGDVLVLPTDDQGHVGAIAGSDSSFDPLR